MTDKDKDLKGKENTIEQNSDLQISKACQESINNFSNLMKNEEISKKYFNTIESTIKPWFGSPYTETSYQTTIDTNKLLERKFEYKEDELNENITGINIQALQELLKDNENEVKEKIEDIFNQQLNIELNQLKNNLEDQIKALTTSSNNWKKLYEESTSNSDFKQNQLDELQTIELRDRSIETNQNTEIFLEEIDLKTSENVKLNKTVEEFQTEFINTNFLLAFRKIQVAILKNKLVRKDAEINSKDVHITELEENLIESEKERKHLIEDLKQESRKKKVLTISSLIQYNSSWLVNKKTQNQIENAMTTLTSYYVLKNLDNWSYEALFMILGILVFKLFNKLLNWWKGDKKQNIVIVN